MTTYDFQAFCVICLMSIAMVMFVWYRWSGWLLLLGDVTIMGLIMLSVVGLVVLVWLMIGLAYYTLAMRHVQIEAERAKADYERAKADFERAKAITASQYLVPVKPGHTLFTNQSLTALHVPELTALPAPIDDSPLIAHAVWFPKAVNALHLIAIGESGSGKSTLARAIVSESSKIGDVVCIDPHGRSNDWLGLKVVGSGRDYEGIDQFMRATLATMSKRYKEYETGRNDFDRLTIVIDETTSIAQKCDNWQQFFSDVSCEGRKVEIRLIVLIHGKGVKTLGLEGQGDLRHNLQFIYLGKHAVKQDKNASSMVRPAVMEIDGVNQLIDTSELTRMIPQNLITRSEKPINEDLGETHVNHEKDDLKQLVSGLDNDYERIVANLLLAGMTDSAIAKHLGGAFDTNKKKVGNVKAKLNGYMAGVQ